MKTESRKNGKFITFEGGEGAGKSTQLEMLKNYLEKNNIPFVFTREPGGTAVCEKIRDILLGTKTENISAECEALLYAASRAQHLSEVVIPALENGRLVICDRYIDSSFAYQGFARGLGLDYIKKINATAVKEYMPDLTVFLKLDPVKSFERKGGADADDRLESAGADFHEAVFKGFLHMAEKHKRRFKVIDAALSAEEVHAQVVSLLKTLLNLS
jgi:dTMP kinase